MQLGGLGVKNLKFFNVTLLVEALILCLDANFVKLLLRIWHICFFFFFLHCSYAQAVWDFLGNGFDTKICTLGTVLDFFLLTCRRNCSSQIFNLWLTGVICALNTIWFAKNKSLHSGVFIQLLRLLIL